MRCGEGEGTLLTKGMLNAFLNVNLRHWSGSGPCKRAYDRYCTIRDRPPAKHWRIFWNKLHVWECHCGCQWVHQAGDQGWKAHFIFFRCICLLSVIWPVRKSGEFLSSWLTKAPLLLLVFVCSCLTIVTRSYNGYFIIHLFLFSNRHTFLWLWI